MPDNSPRGARLDQVSDAGDLVFEAGGERFVVTVDDALERALLEAKQIRSETLKRREPHTTDTLPISQIQQLIRAGADPAKVAARYGLAEALVRRFSASVQTEKQYAIEQFKRVPAPKESRLRTLEEIIDMTLLAARVDRNTLTWSATRRHHEPWHIVARFMSAGRKVHAEWTWDMHDNSVVCLNAAARKLIGEQSLGVGPDGASAAASGVAGAPSITRPVAAQPSSGRESFPVNLGAAPAEARDAAGTAAPSPASVPSAPVVGATGADETTTGATGASPVALPSPSLPAMRPESTESGAAATDPSTATTTDDIPVFRPNVELPPNQNADGAADAGRLGDPTRLADVADVEQPAAPAAPAAEERPRTDRAETARRRSGRSAVPSWDEILFGE